MNAPSTRFELRSLALAVEASLLSESFSEFAKAAWKVLEPRAELKWGWALDAICVHLEAVSSGEITKLLMNVPPGCMKSLLTGVMFPAWEWTNPAKRAYRYLGTAHKQPLALRDNLKCRRLIQSRWYQDRWPIQLTTDQNAKTKFENAETGFREAMAFSGMTGSRGDRVLLDDPLSVDDANSEAALLAAELTFTEALPTRLNDPDKSATIVIMQRLHESDTSGLILSRNLGFTHLMLPMRFEPGRRCSTVLGFSDPRKVDGELLFPERFSEKAVAGLERTMGEYATAGQFQQRPTPRGGGMFKTKHVMYWPAKSALPDFQYVVQSYDTAFTDKTANDPTACTVWGVFTHNKKKCVLLLDAWDERLTYPKLRPKILADWKAVYGQDSKNQMKPGRRADAVLVEEKGSGISLIQDLRAGNVPALSYNPGKADKFGRASQALPLYEMDLMYVLESKQDPGMPITWARKFLELLGKFGPGVTAEDDYVDTLTQAFIFLRDQNLLELPVVEEEEEEKPYRKKKAPVYG